MSAGARASSLLKFHLNLADRRDSNQVAPGDELGSLPDNRKGSPFRCCSTGFGRFRVWAWV